MVMSVNVKIKQKSLFTKKLKLNDVIKLSGLSYGVCDEHYRLTENETADCTLIYDKNTLARGIEVSFEGNDILLRLNLPTSSAEIALFYDVIEKICKKVKAKKYYREEELADLKDTSTFIENDKEGSVCGLKSLYENIHNEKYSSFYLFGVINPISIGKKEIEEINGSLDNFAGLLNRLQSLDVYYAAPSVFKINGVLTGIYAIGPDIPSVVPTKPHIILNQIEGIENWFVMFGENRMVKYDDFINNIPKSEYYDFDHVIVELTENEIAEMVEKYGTKL